MQGFENIWYKIKCHQINLGNLSFFSRSPNDRVFTPTNQLKYVGSFIFWKWVQNSKISSYENEQHDKMIHTRCTSKRDFSWLSAATPHFLTSPCKRINYYYLLRTRSCLMCLCLSSLSINSYYLQFTMIVTIALRVTGNRRWKDIIREEMASIKRKSNNVPISNRII